MPSGSAGVIRTPEHRATTLAINVDATGGEAPLNLLDDSLPSVGTSDRRRAPSRKPHSVARLARLPAVSS
jgi:hypothetical protein